MIGKIIIIMVLVQSVLLQPINQAGYPAANRQPEAQVKQVEKRSITVNANEEVEDLEVAETHVFRPLFSYKQQLLKEQFRNKNRKQVS